MSEKKIDKKRLFSLYLKQSMPKDIPQREIADLTGVTVSTVSGWFAGRTMPAPNALKKIIKKYDLHPVETYCLAYGEETAVANGLISPISVFEFKYPKFREDAIKLAIECSTELLVREWDQSTSYPDQTIEKRKKLQAILYEDIKAQIDIYYEGGRKYRKKFEPHYRTFERAYKILMGDSEDVSNLFQPDPDRDPARDVLEWLADAGPGWNAERLKKTFQFET